jgi:hypothetical protein
MVDALQRSRSYLRLTGYLIDVHPTADQARLEVGLTTGAMSVGTVGDVDECSGPRTRHARAEAALAEAVGRGWFTVEEQREFEFRRYANSVSEMRDHFRTWRGAVLGEDAWDRATALRRDHSGARVWLSERVSIARLRPLALAKTG